MKPRAGESDSMYEHVQKELQQVMTTDDVIARAELLDKISDIMSVLDADEQFCYDENDEPVEEEC